MRGEGAAGYVIGCLALAAVIAPCATAGHLLARRRLGQLDGLVRGLAVFVVVTAAVWIAHVLPGLAGVLSPWTVIACAVLLLLAALRLPDLARDREPAGDPPAPEPRSSRLIATIAVAASIAGALALLLAQGHEPPGTDMTANHLPQVVRWIQTGSMWQLTTYVPYLGHGTYPQNGNVMLLAVTLPWRSTFAVGAVPVVFMVALAAAAHALAREIGAPRASALLAAAAVPAIPIVALCALRIPMLDAPMLAWFAAGALFLLRARRTGDRGELALAGCALGLALGTKWYALPYVAIVLAVWAVTRWRRPQGRVGDAAILAGTVAAFGGLWLVRNWALAGNPLHPARLSVFGTTILDAPRDVARELYGFTIWDYRGDGAVLRERVLPAWKEAFGLLLPLLAAAAAVACLRRPFSGTVVAIGGASLAMGLTYLFIPDTAFGPRGAPYLVMPNARYLVPALLGPAVLAAWLAGRSGRARPIVEALLLVALLDGLRRVRGFVDIEHVAGALAVVGIGALALRRRPVALALAAGAALAWSALLWKDDPWLGHGRADPAIAALQRELPARASVGITAERPAEMPPVLPLFGRRLDNRVRYVGTVERGSLLPAAGREEFERLTRAGRFDFLVVRVRPTEPVPPELGWATDLGYRVLARSPRRVVLRRRR